MGGRLSPPWFLPAPQGEERTKHLERTERREGTLGGRGGWWPPALRQLEKGAPCVLLPAHCCRWWRRSLDTCHYQVRTVLPLPATQSPVQGSPAGGQPGAPGMTPRVSGSSAPACHVPGLALLRFVPTAQQTRFPQPPTTEGGCLCPVAQRSHVSWLPVPAGSGGAGDQSPRTPRMEREGHCRDFRGQLSSCCTHSSPPALSQPPCSGVT